MFAAFMLGPYLDVKQHWSAKQILANSHHRWRCLCFSFCLPVVAIYDLVRREVLISTLYANWIGRD